MGYQYIETLYTGKNFYEKKNVEARICKCETA